MNIKIGSLSAVVAALAVASSSRAQVSSPIFVPFDGAQVTVTFLSSDASFTGDLYFLGSSADDGEGGHGGGVIPPPGPAGVLGQLLFSNHATLAGTSVVLNGDFNEGDLLYFAYNLTQVDPGESLDLFRMDNADDQAYFHYSENNRLGIEDLRTSNPWYDGDYNDIIVEISFAQVPVPAPGALALLGIAGTFSRRRRVN
ncbi:MAG TPA: hypothetical protein VG711_10555 [Phycisphaerales bacterium]|nr:hypothetical protein [Phycisphaerales bacterium]